ncbi:hypothetical protein CFC21_100844 [Triticum aestivum]|uniref:Protein kinase domain-containing protein n=3 Tax=Triticum aestivum TaxID=4565 RepID=A0A9R1M1U1_WHEAT|nr:hypothetical protein CFC21_100844 [Triticum aestivum]
MASVVMIVVVLLFLLAAGAAAAAVPMSPAPRIGMPGCETSCGDAEVPYPFGIGPDPGCFLHQPGFNLTCDRTHDTPRLLLPVSGAGVGKDLYLRVEGIDIESSMMVVFHTVHLSTTGSDDLILRLRGAFRLSSRNELVLTGCNVQSTLLGKMKGNATATVEDGLAAEVWYDVKLSWFGRDVSADKARAPAHAFVAVEGWFDYWLSNSTNATTLDAPVLLDYYLSGDCANNPCRSNHSDCSTPSGGTYICECKSGYEGNPYVPDGCQVSKCLGCYGGCTIIKGNAVCQCPPGQHGNAAMPGGCGVDRTHARNCTRYCGDVHVPFPFGIQGTDPASCYHPGFNLTCDKTNNPPRLLLGDGGQLRVEKINLDNATVGVVYPGAFLNNSDMDRYTFVFRDQGIPSAGEAPYSLSASNELILTGCDVQVVMLGHRSDNNQDILGRCISLCTVDFGEEPEVSNITRRGRQRSTNGKYCYCTGCCQTHISQDSTGGMPKQLSMRPLVEKSWFAESSQPALAFVATEGWFDNLGFSGKLDPVHKQPPAIEVQEVPIILQWEVMSDKPNCNTSGNICKKHSRCKEGDRGYTCHCKDGYDGNPYINDDQGCKARGAGRNNTIIIGVGVGLATAVGLIICVLLGHFATKKVKHRRALMLKRKFFEQNRGQLLQQLVSQRADIAERMIIPLEELEKATNNFDKARELGGGGHGIVYKGILSDLHVVAIKKPKKVLQREIDEFINEVAILSQINHRNVVKLYGCCLETEVPMLVYEFIPNGTLYDHLHIDGPRSLSWEHRLRIAIETAKSLAYLHSTASVPIIHRDVKSVNVLLDDTLTAKVADFGASRYISVEKSGLTTVVQGTIGYLDPMYFYTGRLTEKSDVYSYGVMLVELLTRKKPSSYLSSNGEGLVAHFVTLFEEGNLSDILDPQVTDEGGKEVGEAIALAIACIKLRGEDRPDMRQVELTLEGLRPIVEHGLADEAEIDSIVTNSPLAIDGRSNEGSSR